MKLTLLTNEQARKRYPDDYYDVCATRDVGAGILTPQVLRTIADLAVILPTDATLYVCRDWEGCLFAEVKSSICVGVSDVLCITETGRIGSGGVNQPRYFDSVLSMIASKAQGDWPA